MNNRSFSIATNSVPEDNFVTNPHMPNCTVTINKGTATERSFPCAQTETTLRALSPNAAPSSIEVVVVDLPKKAFFHNNIKTKTVTASLNQRTGDSENSIDAVAKMIDCCASATTAGGLYCISKI
jgi:hypothetical protein